MFFYISPHILFKLFHVDCYIKSEEVFFKNDF